MHKSTWKPWHLATKKMSSADWMIPAPKAEILARQKIMQKYLFISGGVAFLFVFYTTLVLLPFALVAGWILYLLTYAEGIKLYSFLTVKELAKWDDTEARYKNLDTSNTHYRVTQLIKPLAQQQGFLMHAQVRAAYHIVRQQEDESIKKSWGQQ